MVEKRATMIAHNQEWIKMEAWIDSDRQLPRRFRDELQTVAMEKVADMDQVSPVQEMADDVLRAYIRRVALGLCHAIYVLQYGSNSSVRSTEAVVSDLRAIKWSRKDVMVVTTLVRATLHEPPLRLDLTDHRIVCSATAFARLIN